MSNGRTADAFTGEKMVDEITLPVGNIVKSITTKNQTLFSILEESKKREFQGYIAVYFYRFGNYYEGNVILKKGNPIWAFAKFDKMYMGDKAFTRILEEAENNICNVDLHEIIRIMSIVNDMPDGVIKRGGGMDSARWSVNELRHLKHRMEEWRVDGWDVSPLEDVLNDDDINFIKREFETYEKDAASMRELRNRLDSLDTKGHETEVQEIKDLMVQVHRKLIVRKRISELEGAIGSSRREERPDAGSETARYRALAHYWKSMGYNVSRLEDSMSTLNLGRIKSEFKMYERDVATLKKLRELLGEIHTKNLKNEKDRLIAKTYDPIYIPELKKDIYHFGLKVASEGVPAKTVKKKQTVKRTASPTSGTHAGKHSKQVKKVKGARDTRVKSLVRSMGEGASSVSPDLILGARIRPDKSEDPMDHLKRFTFKSFVVDETNKFAHSAAFSVAQNPGKTYNPLLIHSRPGIGKTHLLGAIFNYLREMRPELATTYITASQFMEDVILALRSPGSHALSRYMTSDILIVDDINALAGDEQSQEMFLEVFNTLMARGKQIVVSADGPPKDLPALKAKLRKQFEGGLIADIEVPTMELRTAILIRKGAAMGIVLPGDVIEHIAKNVRSSVRDLEGILAKIHAEIVLRKQTVDLASVTDVLSDYLPPAPPAPTELDSGEPQASKFEPMVRKPPEERAIPSAPTPAPAPEFHDHVELPDGFAWGFSYMVEVLQPDPAFRMFTRLMNSADGLCISRTNPKQLRQFYNIDKADVLWLTDISSKEDTISSSLEEIMEELKARMEGAGKLVIMLDGVEYLMHIHGFDPVVYFLRVLKDAISERKVILLIPLNPRALKVDELAVLERELRVMKGD